jgi:hypothetical protein
VSPADQYKVYCAKCHGPAGHGDGANGLALQHLEVMFQFQNLLLTSVAAFMAGEAAALVA